MSFKSSFLLTADGKQAKAELAATGKAVDGLGQSTAKMGREGRTTAASTKKLGGSAAFAAANLKRMADAERLAITNTRKLGRVNQTAAAHVGNLTAQFNDIGMMMMAGQNPPAAGRAAGHPDQSGDRPDGGGPMERPVRSGL